MNISKLFLNDKNILVLILINAFIIFAGGFGIAQEWKQYIDFTDNLITFLFFVELFIKLKHYGAKKYFSSYWNIFDFVLIILSLPTFIYSILNIEHSVLSFMLVFRVLRVFKSFRFLKFIPGMGRIIKGIKRAVKTSILILLAFAVYVFIAGIVSFNLFQNDAPQYFGNPLKAMYSTFKIFTVEGWYEIPDQISQQYSNVKAFFIQIYFIGLLLSGGILGLSLVNSIFVDAMVSDNNDDIDEKLKNIEDKLDKILNTNNYGTQK